MASGILGIGITGLNAAMGAVRTTQHNIANANTPGFHRQEVKLNANPPTYSGAGFFGNGVAITTVTRLYSQFLDNELMRSQGQQARYEVYSTYAGRVDRVLGDKDSGLASALSSFFGAVQEVTNDPTSMAAREAMLAAGRNLAGRMRNLGDTMHRMQDGIDDEIAALADQANAHLHRIAELNERITRLQAAGHPPNDLLDEREQLTAKLNELVGVNVVRGGDGSYHLYLEGGQPLMLGNQANTFTVVADPYDPRSKTLAITGANLPLDGQGIQGGRLGGLLGVRQEVLLPALQALGQLAIGLAQQFNLQHAVGFALDGSTTGLDFFTLPALRAPVAAPGNTGTAQYTLTLANSQNLRRDDYTLSFDGSNYQLARKSDGTAYTAASLSALNALIGPAEGFTVNLASGAVATGDRFELRNHMADAALNFSMNLSDPAKIAAAATAAGAPGDNGNALALAALQSQKTLGGTPPTATFHQVYAQLVSRIAGRAGEADIATRAYDTLTRNALEAQQSLSGVNLDEEAANLIRYQQAYQAAARALQVANTLLDELLSIGR